MDADGTSKGPGLTTRRFTGATRGDATAGFKIDWPGLSRHFTLVAEAWGEDTHTLTVMLQPLPSEPPAQRTGAVRDVGEGDPARPSS
jgi:hypothetical protein